MKDEQFDNLFRNALGNMDGVPPQAHHWDKEDIFERIQVGLNGNDSNTRRSFFDLAAAVVIIVTAVTYSLTFFTKSIIDEVIPEVIAELPKSTYFENSAVTESINEPSVLESKILKSDENTTIASVHLNESIATAIETKPIAFNEYNYKETSVLGMPTYSNKTVKEMPEKLEQSRNVSFLLPFSNHTNTLNRKPSKIKVTLPVGMAYTAGSIAPVVGLNTAINLKGKADKTSQLNLGIAAYGLLHNIETENLTVEPVVFAESSFGLASDQDKFISGHAVGVGYQLNESDLIDGRAIKLNYTVAVKKRFKIAAEALVSEGFSKIQPGFKLTFI